MFMVRLAVLALVVAFAPTISADVPALGEPVTEQSVGSITVFADGEGLPEGSGSVGQGRALYERQCLACHGVNGVGGLNDHLAGGHVALSEVPVRRTIGSYWPYAVPVFDYVRRAMPFLNPGSLSDDETYAVVAYLLHVNGVLNEDAVLDADGLRAVRLPNRDRFFSTFRLPD